MDKQELIRKYEELWKEHSPFHEPVPYTSMVELFLKDLKLLDEPEKVTIPQFVADWIEVCKKKGVLSLGGAIQLSCPEMYEWLMDWNNQEIFARAWLDGYEVEKEKRYLVKLKGIEKEKCYLNYNFGRVWLFYNQENFYGYRAHHTRKELEDAGFGWVFDCEGIEIEEVTE